MERKEVELNAVEESILEELVFTLHFSDLQKKVGIDVQQLKLSLKHLLELGLIKPSHPGPDNEIDFEIENFEEYYSEYYYLATKNGLKRVFC